MADVGSPGRSRTRIGRTTITGAALYAFCLAWVVAGLGHVRAAPAIGWLPLPLLAVLAALTCARAARRSDLGRSTRRFWARMGGVAVLLGAGTVSNMADAVGGPVPSPHLSARTLTVYLTALALVLWSLLRLPAGRRGRADWARFTLDAGIMLIASGSLAWHLSRHGVGGDGAPGGAAVLLVLVLAGLVAVTFVKVSFAGTGQLDRAALYFLASGGLVAGAAGSLSTGLAAASSLLSLQLAAGRQRRAPAEPALVAPVARRFTVLPYLAAAAVSILLISQEAPRGGEDLTVAGAVVALTVLVMVRQFIALRENGRLLDTVDTNRRQLHDYRDRLAHEASHDALTEIPNRSLFADQVAAVLGTGLPFHVALLDLDDFKTVNDRLGHGTGDALLKAVSRRLHEALRTGDTVARFGGDEFTLLLPGRCAEQVAELLREVVDAVHRPMLLDGQDMNARVSVGVTESQPGDTPEAMLRRADVAMYAAKTAGGGRWTWFDPIMDRLADEDARLGNDLRRAIARDQLFVLYQPIVELPHGRLAGVEALVRWRHPEHGLISPAVFIPLAERNGTILELGWWVMRQVVRQAAEWEQQFGPLGPEKVSVNISARQLGEPGFPARVGELLAEHGVDPYRIVAEVTETAVLGTGQALDAVRALHELGMRVALDDFGTGQSSLSLLVDTPVSVLKVDKSFVDGVTEASPQAVIVDSLIRITDGLRIEAVAEGVETAEQAERLHSAGYRLAQGFHFARPMPAEDIALLLDDAPQPVVTGFAKRSEGLNQVTSASIRGVRRGEIGG